MYIHERDNWTNFRWDTTQVSLLQEKVFRKQGLLYGRLSSLGFDSKLRAMAENLTYDVVYSSEIEGIRLNVEEVRSSIARKLGIENVKYTAPSHYVDSVVGVMLEAVRYFSCSLFVICLLPFLFLYTYLIENPRRTSQPIGAG